MALRVWLPLNGDLENKGISGDISFSLISGNSFTPDGKTGDGLKLTKLQQILNTSSCMTGAKEVSYAFWVKVNTAWSANWLDGIRWISTDGSSTSTERQEFYTNCTYIGTWYKGGAISGKSFTPGVWTHLAATINYNTGQSCFYINGILQGSVSNVDTTYYCRGDFYIGDNGVDILENDVRIYDHCLSQKEVKEISQGLVLHYKLDGLSGGIGDNLLWDTAFYDGIVITPTSNNYYDSDLRYYNTSASNLQIGNGEATILLNSTANLGFAFERFVHIPGSGYVSSETLELDPTSYYTLSCEAKTTMNGANLAIGLSYYNTNDSPTWRGGTNKKPFTATNEWQTFSLTFKPDADTKAICYCFTVNGTSGGTETATIRHCKLERGTIATSWSLHPKEWTNYIYGQYRDSSGYNQNAYEYNMSFISGQSPRYNVMADFSWGGYLSSAELSTSKGNTIAFWCSASDWSEYNLAGGICQGSNWSITSYNNNLILKLVSHISAENSNYNLSQTYSWTLIPTSSLNADWHYFVLTYLNHEIKFYLDGILYKTINNISTDIADYFYTNYLTLASLPVS